MTFARHHGRRDRSRPGSRGSVLVEFALVSLAFYLLIAAIVTFGFQLHTAQVAQDAARLGARELALVPLPASLTFEQALADPRVRTSIYSADALVIDLDDIPGGMTLDQYFGTLPAVNRALRPLMIYDQVRVPGPGLSLPLRRLLRVPGALIVWPSAPSGLSVAVPSVVSRDADGIETIEWLPVVEEVRSDRTQPGPFSIQAAGPDRGLVGLRVNVPVQSSAMAAFKPGADPYATNGTQPIVADDSGVVESNAAPGPLAGARSVTFPIHDGPYGLGHVQALGKELRPYRRLITAQAFFRREVFAEQSQ